MDLPFRKPKSKVMIAYARTILYHCGESCSSNNKPFRKPKSKVMIAYAQSEQYYTIVESRVHLTIRE